MADETKLTAATRLEKLLDNIAGGENEVTPATRLEKFLSYIADAMEGGGPTYVDTIIASAGAKDSQTSVITYVFNISDFSAELFTGSLFSTVSNSVVTWEDIKEYFNPDKYLISVNAYGLPVASSISTQVINYNLTLDEENGYIPYLQKLARLEGNATTFESPIGCYISFNVYAL